MIEILMELDEKIFDIHLYFKLILQGFIKKKIYHTE